MDGYMYGWIDGPMYGLVAGFMHERMDGWLDGWVAQFLKTKKASLRNVSNKVASRIHYDC